MLDYLILYKFMAISMMNYQMISFEDCIENQEAIDNLMKSERLNNEIARTFYTEYSNFEKCKKKSLIFWVGDINQNPKLQNEVK